MRVASIKRRILADPTTNLAYKNAKRVSLGMRCILDSVLELVAASPDLGRWQPNPELDGDESLAEKVARHADALDALSEVEGALIGLARLRLIVVTESGGIAIPALLRSQSTNATNGSRSVGKRRTGESTEAYQRRTAEHQAAMDAQGNLLLSVVGGNMPPSEATEALAQALRARLRVVGADAEPITQSVTQPAADWVTETLTQTGVDLSVLGSVPLEPRGTAAAAEDSKEDYQAAAAAAVLPSAPASPGENLEANPATNLKPNPAPNPAANPKPNPEETLQAIAKRLAGAGHAKNNWSKPEQDAAAGHMEGYLRQGYTADQLHRLIKTEKVCHGAAYYGKGPLMRVYGTPEPAFRMNGAAPASSDAVEASLSHPRLDEHPRWKEMDHEALRHVVTFLKAMDEPDPAKRARTFSIYKGRWSQEFDLVRKAYPAVDDMANWQPERRTG